MSKNKYKYASLVERAENLGVTTIITDTEINFVQNELGVLLPNDFKEINLKASYEGLNYFDFYCFDTKSDYSVIGQTIGCQKSRGQPKEYLNLAYEAETIALIRTISTEESQVILCNLWDYEQTCQGKPMEYNPTIFPSFAAFYEFLLDEEEKLRAEE